MIAPLVERPRVPRQHSAEVRRDEKRIPRRIERLIENRPVATVAAALVFGATIGWLVKRKQW